HIHFTAEVRIPHEPYVIGGEVVGGNMEVVSRHEPNTQRRRRGIFGARRCGDCPQHECNDETSDAHFTCSSDDGGARWASFASSSSMRFFNSGSRRNTGAARPHSRASIAGSPAP